MADLVLSLILPIRNVEKEINGFLQFACSQIGALPAEVILVDIGSTDSTVLEAVQALHAAKLRGCVVQNGDTTIASALNTGLSRAHGTYVSFLFARRLYMGFLPAYYQAAVRSNADFVFGSVTEEAAKRAGKRLPGTGPEPAQFVRQLLSGELQVDIAALLVRTAFLIQNHIQFTEDCRYGYAEEFVLRCLLLAKNVAQAPTLLQRNQSAELRRGKTAPCDWAIFQRVDAMMRILDVLHSSKSGTGELIALFQERQIPKTIFSCIDVLLREGHSCGSINNYLHHAGYHKMLLSGKHTGLPLQRKIFLWKTMPWLYRPETPRLPKKKNRKLPLSHE